MKEIPVRILEGKKLQAVVDGHILHTDQPQADGGDGTGPKPSDLFLASLATCGAFFARLYCDKRGLNADGLDIVMEYETAEKTRLVTKLVFKITTPEDFPDAHRAPLERAIQSCYVKKHLKDDIEVETAFVN
ncbi:OsmC family protein [Oceanidesulfovibrio indonesiensis]|uniref:OsmC family protein n=1 Tax=Oceanidesulfovibrio indonesiensis TaxID=54767 RepID=UPI0014313F2D|nr:OsmC family protein [Oceanidesulfovibrio indonesiensis]